MKRDIAFLVLGGVSLLFSFFGTFPVDPAWLAILLCGIPILKEAAVGLVTRFDIKADVLVSLALIASVAIGEIFAAGRGDLRRRRDRLYHAARLPAGGADGVQGEGGH